MDQAAKTKCLKCIIDLLKDNGKMLIARVGDQLSLQDREAIRKNGGLKNFLLDNPLHFTVLDLSVSISAVYFIKGLLRKHRRMRLDAVGVKLNEKIDNNVIIFDDNMRLKVFIESHPTVFAITQDSCHAHHVELKNSPSTVPTIGK